MLPKVILHTSVSLDSRIDWFEPDAALFYELVSRWHEDASLVGSGTVLLAPEELEEDDPDRAPFEPKPGDDRPLLVIPDSGGRVRSWRALLDFPYWRAGVSLCSEETPPKHLQHLERQGIDVIVAGRKKVDLRAALEELNLRYGVTVVRVDSGGTLNGVLLREDLVSEVSLLVEPVLVGGTSSKSFFRGPDLDSPEGLIRLRLTHVEKMRGEIVWLTYDVEKSAAG